VVTQDGLSPALCGVRRTGLSPRCWLGGPLGAIRGGAAAVRHQPASEFVSLIGADERGLLRLVRHILLDDESIELVLLID
jgi:hypothetical protein